MRLYHQRKSAIATWKLDRGCAECGPWEQPEVLQFDHVRGVKLGHPANLWSKPLAVLVDELEKCEVVCANHHAIRTHARRGA